MAIFQYTAFDAKGNQKKGLIEADNIRRARQLIRDKGLTPLDVSVSSKSHQQKNQQQQRLWFKRSLSSQDLALFTRELANLIGAAMPIDEALKAVADQSEKTRLKSIVLGVRAKVLEGYTLAKSLADFPSAFPKVYCATVAAGEKSGHLDLVLNRLADHTEKQTELKLKVQHALIYPGIMTSVSVLIVIFLLAMVVPTMIEVFKEFDRQLPTATEILLVISDGTRNYGIYLVILLVIGGLLFRYFLQQENFRRRFHLFLLKLPLVGRSILIVNTARFCRTLGILSSAGVPMVEAIQISAELLTNIPIRESVMIAANKVREGSAINLALKQTGYFPPLSIHFIANGEASGRLEDMLQRAAEHQEQAVNRNIDTTLSVFEPTLILLMGGIVLFIVLAILLPMFEMTQLIA